MASFRDIVSKYSYSTDIDTTHSYGETYQSYFTPIQQNVLNILLIGVEHNNYLGGILRVCHEFFPNATFTVVDNNSNEKFDFMFYQPNVTLFSEASIHDHDFVMNTFVTPGITFDIIIEDVSPRSVANMAMIVKEYSQLLNPGGMMFIEDLEYPGNADELNSQLPANLQGCSQFFDLRASGRYDDILYLVTAPITMSSRLVSDMTEPELVESAPVEFSLAESEPVELLPVEAMPVESAPVEAIPVESAPVEAMPVESAPLEAMPVESAPVEAMPVESAPVEAMPVESAPVESVPIESAPIESVPVESAPVESVPVESAPVESIPVESIPVESIPVEAMPVESAPVESMPVESMPVEAMPVESAPVESAPVESAPVESVPIESVPIESVPVESMPVESVPVESAPVESVPVESAPVE